MQIFSMNFCIKTGILITNLQKIIAAVSNGLL